MGYSNIYFIALLLALTGIIKLILDRRVIEHDRVKLRDDLAKKAELLKEKDERLLASLEQLAEKMALLKRKEKHTQLIIDTMPGLVLVLDKNLTIISTNHFFAEMFGVSVEAMLGQPLELFIQDLAILNKIRIDTLSVLRLGHTVHESELYLKDIKTGERRSFTLSRKMYHDGVEGVIVMGSDITNFKALFAALQVSEHLYSKLLKECNNLILQIDDGMVIVYSNPTCKKLLGLEFNECIGMKWTEIIAPNHREMITRQFARWSTWATRMEEVWECDVIDLRGNIKHMMWGISLTWHEYEFVGLQANGSDITSQKELEIALITKEKELINIATTYETAFLSQRHE